MSQFVEQMARPATYSSVKAWRERYGRYRLVGARCTGCGATFFPRRPACLGCQGRSMEAYQCAHTGTLVVAWPQVNLVRLMGYADLPQRYVGVIRLDDGTHLEAEVLGIQPEQATGGTRVGLVFRKLRRESNGNEMYGYKFTPLDDEPGGAHADADALPARG